MQSVNVQIHMLAAILYNTIYNDNWKEKVFFYILILSYFTYFSAKITFCTSEIDRHFVK